MDRAAWLEERRKGIGGSDIPVILGLSPWKTRRQLCEEKRGQRHDDPETPDMMRGKALESIVADLWFLKDEKAKKIYDSDLLRHHEYPWMVANPDRVFIDEDTDFGVLEIKCPRLRKFNAIKRGGLPDYMIVQLQWYMTFSLFNHGAWAIFNAESWELLSFRVEPDPELQATMIEAGRKFWEFVKSDAPAWEMDDADPPPPLNLPQAPSDLVTRDDPEWTRAVRAYREAREIREEGEILEEESKARILTLMESAPVVEGAGVRVYNTLSPGRKTLDKKLLEKELGDISRFEKQGRPFRSFRVYNLREER